jgi:hypothetical protein
MEYKEIVAVSGLPGLYQMVSSKGSGAVIRSLADKSTRFASSRIHNFTPLDSIEVFTTSDTVNLAAVFKKMKAPVGDLTIPDPGADNTLVKEYFKKVFPELDDKKVHLSDLKKMLKWYDILNANELLDFKETVPASEEPDPEAGVAVPPAE